tara:strand:+ start:714 stop:887 length:174 start_codon:yes stop_codon:yes gene_type:complete
MRISRKALREKIKSQTDGFQLAYKKYKQGIYSKKEYDLEVERLDNDFENFFESGGKE